MVIAARAREIEIDPKSDLAKQLGEANGRPLVLIVGGTRYVVRPQEALTPATFRDDEDTRRLLENVARRRAEHPPEEWEGYDSERVREVLDRVAGTLSDEEANRWIEDVYRAREQGSRPFKQSESQ
jgi:hypothetical protein